MILKHGSKYYGGKKQLKGSEVIISEQSDMSTLGKIEVVYDKYLKHKMSKQ